MMVIPLRSRIDPVSSEPTAPCGDDLASTYRVSSESAPLFLVARAPLDHLLSAAHEQHFPWPQRAAFPLMADVPPRRADSRPAAANATAGAAASTATPTAPTWDFLTVHTQRALKQRHSEQDECDERDKRDERDARRSTNGDDPSRLMSLMLANSSAHPARPCSSAHPAPPRANDDGAVVAANPSLQPLPSLAGPVTPPAAFPPSHQPGAFSGLESHGHGLAPICATPASVSASHVVSLHASPATFPPPLPALFTLRQASMPRGALLPLPELLLPGLPRCGPGIGSLSEALFRRLTGLTGLTGITGLTGLPRATGATGKSGGFSCALCGRTFPTVHALGGHKSMHRKGVHRSHTSATSTSSTRNGGSGRRKGSSSGARNGGSGNVSKNKGCGSSSRGGAPSGGVRPELPSPARFLKRCKVTAADVDDANAAADAAADAASNAVADADANAAADAAADAADVDAAAQTSHATRGTDTAHQEPSERSATEGGNPAKASPLTPPVTPTNEETVPASWPKAGGALGAAETSVQADQIPRAAGTGRGETGTLAGDVGEQVVGESGGACEKHMRVQLKQAIKERLVQAHLLQARLLQARLLQARLSQPRQLQTRQALHPHGGGEHTSCSGAGVAPWSPPALVLEAAQSTSCLQGRGAPASFSPAAIAACSPTALSTMSGATAGPVCASDLNLPPADVAGGVVSEAGGMDTEAVIMVNEDADLALAALAIECEAREAREAGDLPSSDECMNEADTPRTAPNPGCTAQGDFPGTACLAGRDASAAGASGNALGIARDAVFLFACNLGAEKVFCANDVFAANSSKLDGADSRAGCLDLTLHL
ncbi:unnamed protein product [Closterium sp. NIES-54]